MNYFTPERYVALQSPAAEAMDLADAAWEEAVAKYDARLLQIRSKLPDSAVRLIDDFYLHDAAVLGIGGGEDDFAILLQLDPPPHDIVMLWYSLTDRLEHKLGVLPPEFCSSRPQWLYDEFDLAGGSVDTVFTHSILLSDGQEFKLTYSELRLAVTRAVFPTPLVSVFPSDASNRPNGATAPATLSKP